MGKLVLLLVLAAACSASVIEFVSLPTSVKLPSSSSASDLRLSQLPQLNANLLGLSTEAVPGFEVESDLFSRPRAIAVIRVEGVDKLNEGNAATYKLENDRSDQFSTLNEQLAHSFGGDREFVTVNRDGISGSAIAQATSEQKVSDEIKTKLPDLREELEQIYRLAAAITAQKAKFETSSAPDVYRVTIGGLAGKNLNEEDRTIAINDIQRAVDKLASALSTVYGDQTVVEVVAVPNAVKYAETSQEQPLVRRKRAADLFDTDKNLKTWREQLNVYVFVSTDYPAMFAIFAGLTIVLALAVLYTVVGMMSMDPSKDSIIYRMTTTRMKKA
ncbi:renin receptor-like protein [Ancylostoma caninum]|uniref:Renin receptor-like protein n=1 Tax=Ancylostoma caninum TaxID=29170 RepID=A0A368GYD0_ANCCA|nr:renin receptor-like protein [Ancylostoma caninum]